MENYVICWNIMIKRNFIKKKIIDLIKKGDWLTFMFLHGTKINFGCLPSIPVNGKEM